MQSSKIYHIAGPSPRPFGVIHHCLRKTALIEDSDNLLVQIIALAVFMIVRSRPMPRDTLELLHLHLQTRHYSV